MLEYGFANYALITPVQAGDSMGMSVPVRLGTRGEVNVVSGGGVGLLLRRGDESGLSLEVALVEAVRAPVQRGDVLGEVRVRQAGEVVAVLPAVAGEDVPLPGYVGSLLRIRDRFMLLAP